MNCRFVVLLLLWAAWQAAADPFPKGDPKIGKNLEQKSCSACHISMYGGDGSKVYTRSNRIVKTPQQLLARIGVCSANTNAGLFPEDEEHVAAFLNQQYYKFKQ
jgi:mono/diheme cytochrome c family protein